jgi:cation/acetate symporter
LNSAVGYYFAAQGSLIVFVVQLFLFVKQQDKIDREFGVAEETKGGHHGFFNLKGGFIENLPKIYGLYTGASCCFSLLMAILGETLGVSSRTPSASCSWPSPSPSTPCIGWLSRTMQVERLLRGRPPGATGVQRHGDCRRLDVRRLVRGHGRRRVHGRSPYLAFVVGWTGGYVLVATLMAPYLRKFGCYTVPDFIGTRYGGNVARFCAVLVLVVASFTYVTAQINATGTIASRALNLPFEVGVWFGLAGILVCSMLGGMRAVTWTQVAQYIVLIIAYLMPVFWMSKQGFGFLPQFSYGGAVERIMELEPILGVGTLPGCGGAFPGSRP